MTWITIPNELVSAFTGKPIKTEKLNTDLEVVYKPIKCVAEGCSETFTSLPTCAQHLADVHDLPGSTPVEARSELEDATTARLIMGLLLSFNREDAGNLLRPIRKTNDSYHATEVWRRVYPALAGDPSEFKLKKEQYDWLHQLLDRKLPASKEAREAGVEQQSVLMYIFGLSEDNVRQAFTTLPDRRKATEGE